ncbi:probable Golgi SNAP receptor complex member 2 isoform X2 [Zootermopsis nevadensis]|uniref:probable Golgi SNAP receptor complex member 2 isoform X2 n=1 Tax=Zootermopsis nevadensis TaxID=136037 RepID=UPI000B8E4B2C|nr:probable Golgi SNAP receptor complex member 2 isoform X2 [Zootermopsis nevadensis]
MESLYHQTNRLVQETQQCFEKLEKVSDTNSDVIEREIQARIDSITSNCEKMDMLNYKEPLSRRTNCKLRIEHLKYDRVHLQAALDTFKNRKYQRLQEEREREALLNHHFQPNNYQETSILMDQSQMFYVQKHQNSLQNANHGVDEMLQSGVGILENLRDQRMTIKGAHRRLYDIANTLGLSNTTMRLIERFPLLVGISTPHQRMLQGADEVYNSTWFAFKSLQFLWDKGKPLETRSTINSD